MIVTPGKTNPSKEKRNAFQFSEKTAQFPCGQRFNLNQPVESFRLSQSGRRLIRRIMREPFCNEASFKRFPHSSGFTLIELLVVITILGILTALLLPDLGKAKAKAQGVYCRNNLRQLTVAFAVYSGDFSERLVGNGTIGCLALSMTDKDASSPDGLKINNGNWVHGVMGAKNGTPISNTDPELVTAGALFPYAKNTGLYKCPADRRTAMVGGMQLPTTRSTAMNEWLNPLGRWSAPNPPFRVYRKQSDLVLPGPSEIWVFVDEDPDRIDDGVFFCMPSDPVWQELPASTHGNVGGFSFADGHVESRKWRDPFVLSHGQSAMTSIESEDLQWTHSHTSISQASIPPTE
jgi:prepilin-type N-terminal cleavage/methylation domain-containing protein/prepilin-type processing-associated H-X9-DG protein